MKCGRDVGGIPLSRPRYGFGISVVVDDVEVAVRMPLPAI